jgi:adenylate cyclase
MLPKPTTNPVYFLGKASDEFSVGVGETFIIGDTFFTLHDNDSIPERRERTEYACAPNILQQLRFVDPDQRIDALLKLPELIRQTPSDDRLEEMVTRVLLHGVPRADAAAVVLILPDSKPGDPRVAVRCSSRRDVGMEREVKPSRRLVHRAIAGRLPFVHLFTPDACSDDFTIHEPETEWAICVPLQEETCTGLYLSGRLARELRSIDSVARDAELQSDVKFVQLVADIFGSLRQISDIQRRLTMFKQFFSRQILEAMSRDRLNELLEPRQRDVTVMFCDIRGSVHLVEQGQKDLLHMWEIMSQALGIMSEAIQEYGGVVGDLQGDAAMGFWGWPTSHVGQIEEAARAALAIHRKFSKLALQKSHPLTGFACGIGLAHGPAIAGRIGTLDQFKFDVFGPVVNLSSRLESMTKYFRVPILVNEPIAEYLAGTKPWCRTRLVGKVLPVGFSTPVTLSELLPPAVEPGTLAEPRRLNYESALQAFHAGEWQNVARLLTFADGPSDILKGVLARHPDGPPAAWDGVIVMERK